MRFHVPALPGQALVRSNSSCAYTQKVRKFSRMMVERGHDVFLYGGSEQDAICTEYVPCYPDLEPPPFDVEAWAPYNAVTRPEIERRAEPGDVLCLIAGRCQQRLAEGLALRAVEFGVGYGGVFCPFKVFESYMWMHVVYAEGQPDAHAIDGRFYDAVIPNAFELEEFPEGAGGDYLLYLGRLTRRKGLEIVCEAARRSGRRLVIAGEGDYEPDYGEVVGPVGPDRRAELLGGALALLSPTLYLEPFGGAAVEAQLCGTPAITTDFGAFVETVVDGATGYRCKTMGEFVDAIGRCAGLDREFIRARASVWYSLQTVGERYQRYFEQLETLDEAGFYTDWSGL